MQILYEVKQFPKMKGIDKCVPTKIGTHENYINLLNKIRSDTCYISLVQIEGIGQEDPIVANANKLMELIGSKKVKEWPGTRSFGKGGKIFHYKSKREFFHYLYSFDAFFFEKISKYGVFSVKETDFGLDDIIFMDKDENILLFTTTHEGDIYINEKYI